MFFKKLNRKGLGFALFGMMFLLMVVYSVELADAATVEVKQDADKTYVCFNRKTGAFTDIASSAAGCKDQGYGQSSVKIINDDYAYCINWKLKYKADSKYEADASWKDTSENAIKAGFLINYIQEVNSKGYDTNKAYSNAAATLNTFFATEEKDSGSYDFSSNSEFSGYLSKASDYYNSIKGYMTTLPKPTIRVEGGTVLSYNDTTNKFFSGKVTIGNLHKTYGGENDTVTYTLSAKVGSNSVSICTDAKGTDCKTGDVSISGKTTYSFYIFVDKDSVSEGASIIVNIKGSNKSTYYSSVLYDDTVYDNTQKLITLKELPYPRSTSMSETLLVPVLNKHTINAYKVDEDGEEICGATLEIYRDDPKGENIKNRIATNTDDDDGGNDCRITYISDTVIEEDDDFYNHDYYLIERSAPDGFVLSDSVRHFKPENKLSLVCYKTVDGELEEADDPEYCYPENYSFMCKNNSNPTDIVEPVNGNCPTTSSDDDSGISTNATTGNGEVELNALYAKLCYNIKDKDNLKEVDNSYCNSSENYTKVWNGYGNVTVRQPNVRNVVNISKMDITNNKEVVGASLKICTKASYEADGNDCDAALNYDGVAMSWTSDDVSYSIYGILKGEYYIIEETPPKGYLQATTAVKFSIDEYGKVVTDNETITNADFVNNGSVIVVDNDLSEITISKQDMATSKELPGARLSICRTYPDENGEVQMLVDQYTGDCIEAVLYNGEVATWISTNKAKEISGLDPGTYYLVERIAPTDYSTAESILFTLKEDGTLVDKDGKPLSNNKIVMKDEPIDDTKTGSLNTYIVIGIVLVVGVLGIGSYYYLNKKPNNIDSDKVNAVLDKKKVRKRKIHKKASK